MTVCPVFSETDLKPHGIEIFDADRLDMISVVPSGERHAEIMMSNGARKGHRLVAFMTLNAGELRHLASLIAAVAEEVDAQQKAEATS